MRELTIEQNNELKELAATTMLQYVKTKLPISLRRNTDDIMAEIWTSIGYLS